MAKVVAIKEKEALEKTLQSDLMSHYGPIIGGEDLYKVLGYKTSSAFRLALNQGDINLSIFHIEKRRGRFSLTIDIAKWLVKQKYKSQKEENMTVIIE